MTPRTTKQLRIRPARINDRAEVDRLHDICLWTGANGAGAQDLHEDPRLLGEIYLGPYLVFEPDLAFVLEAADGKAVGYVLGARDTAGFEKLLEEKWWPELRERYPLGRFPSDSADADLVRKIHNPQRTDPTILTGFPAHLHVDILPEGQGDGNGRLLLETLFSTLRDLGVDGVHLVVSPENTNAIGFYKHLGFELLQGSTYGKTL